MESQGQKNFAPMGKDKMLVTKEIEIDMGHRVPNHKSKCSNLHGHRYKIEAGVDDKVISTEGVSDEGMVIDFGDLKAIMMEVIDGGFDHGFVMYDKDPFRYFFDIMQKGELLKISEDTAVGDDKPQKILFVDFIPTAENLAKHWFELLEPRLRERQIKLKHVKVWETPTSTATYINPIDAI